MTWVKVGGEETFLPFGDGSYGAITHSTNYTVESSPVFATTYTVDSGVTATLQTGEPLIIFAQDKITINGTIDGFAKGGSAGGGGAGASGGGGNGEDGGNGTDGFTPIAARTGGNGGGGGNGRGDFGGDGGTGGSTVLTSSEQTSFTTTYNLNNLRTLDTSPLTKFTESSFIFTATEPWYEIINNIGSVSLGHGGGGGGGGAGNPGAGGNGADGGRGGGGVILVAPEIEINSTFDLRGADGGNGGDGIDEGDGFVYQIGGGGGGGGGSGGSVHLIGTTITDNGTYLLSGGSGGSRGLGAAGGSNGSSGGSGDAGEKYIISFAP